MVATYLIRDKVDKIVYTHIDNQHPDSKRFVYDCQNILGRVIEVNQSRYGSIENVFRQFKYIRSTKYAICTDILKKRVRKEWEFNHPGPITYVIGYDLAEEHRAKRLVENNTDDNIDYIFPLIENKLYKEDAHAILEKLKIKRPKMYDLGYANNNCVGCIRGGMGYWNKIRVDFPEVFNNMAILERELSLHCLKECFLDELEPGRGRMSDEISQECNMFCYSILNVEENEK
jgi:hypothetical protein